MLGVLVIRILPFRVLPVARIKGPWLERAASAHATRLHKQGFELRLLGAWCLGLWSGSDTLVFFGIR